jgi:hypothetical protein
MKFEHFNNLNSRKIKYLKYLINLAKIKKQKLKLGLVSFEIVQITFNNIKIFEYLEMRYSKQDNTKNDENKLSNRLSKMQ